VFRHDGSQGNRTRATMKALPHPAQPRSPLRKTYPHFIKLMRMRADISAVGAVEQGDRKGRPYISCHMNIDRALRMARVFCKCA
jgi:hypothetical protein